ncbi:hypothetical protein C4D60_Mb03t04680 [Musa balbisiana]|uniref:non-specific serine/threonine protein kinase n=1 Tax=Musa balbisiana TaxID=52838 RepID=A0A4S8J7I9_MUSBA|nr:hypothetical protein C4D60_Mb03t04680 [Musa balbisiana]
MSRSLNAIKLLECRRRLAYHKLIGSISPEIGKLNYLKLLSGNYLSGIIPPELEYMQSGRATEKTDVYSFGVLVLEVLSGKRPTDSSFIEKGLNIVGWLNFLIVENRQREIIDPSCEGVQRESLDALLSVAIQCVSSSPEDRPTMHRVVQMLESEGLCRDFVGMESFICKYSIE